MPNGAEGTQMCDLDGDGIYTTILPFPYDSHQTYKFVNGCGSTWENPGFEDLPEDCTEGLWNDRYVDVYEDNQFVGDVFGVCEEILDNSHASPTEHTLHSTYPNPFNPATTVSFSMTSLDYVSVRIYDLKGSLIETLANGYYQPGSYSITWDASEFPSGLYAVSMQASNFESAQIITLVK
jgi:hypothetical protein